MNVKEFLERGYKFEAGDIFKYSNGNINEVSLSSLRSCNTPSDVDCRLTVLHTTTKATERAKEMEYKYEKVEFDNYHEIVSLYESDELYVDAGFGALFKSIDLDSALISKLRGINLYRKVKKHWTDKLDGTKENGVLCNCSYGDDSKHTIELIVNIFDGAFQFIDTYGAKWQYATPLTKTEIMALADNAPE